MSKQLPQEKKEKKGGLQTDQLSDSLIAERTFDMKKLMDSAMIRETSHPQFDGMSYMKWNETNEMADISYLAPKVNKQDSRITTGVTHEKDSSMVSFLLNMNFEGTVRVFHKDKELYDVGTALTNLVRKSREDENYDDKRPVLYRNFVAQGTSFAEEQYIEMCLPNKVVDGEIDFGKLDEVKWKEGPKRNIKKCETTFLDGKKVFLENIREKMIQKQPGVITVEYLPKQELESIWGNNKNWALVPDTYSFQEESYTQGSIYADWLFGAIDESKYCQVKVYRPYDQRYQTYINNIPMLPAGFPLSVVSPSGLIPISKGDADPMNMFAYSKSDPSKAKVDQAVFDKVLQNMLVKHNQSAAVPRGNLTGKVFDPSILMGGKVISDLDPKDIPALIDNPGITQSDFSFYQLLKEQIDSKTLSALLEGQPAGGDMTLGQYMDMQKKSILKLGGRIDGMMQWERQMLQLRTYNLIAKGARKSSVNEEGIPGYEDVTVEAEVSSGSKGLNIIRFDEENYKTSEDVFNEENQYEEDNGTEAQIVYLNPLMLKDMINNPEYHIQFEVIPVDKNNDKLAQVMFVKMIADAANLFGMDSLQVGKLKKRYAAKFGEQFDSLFLGEQELEMNRMEAQQAEIAAAQLGGGKPKPGGGKMKSPAPEEPGAKDMMMQI